MEGESISGQSGQPRTNGLHTAYLDRQITLFAPIDRAVRQWKSEKELVNKYHRVRLISYCPLDKSDIINEILYSVPCKLINQYFQTDIDNENLILNHMTNVAVKTHQMTERKLSSLVTGGPPLWITRHRHNSRYSSPSRSQQSSRNQQNVILTIQC